jgi:hypothetical protein
MIHSNENITEGTMHTDNDMAINKRLKYLRKIKKRYQESSTKEGSRLLDEMHRI